MASFIHGMGENIPGKPRAEQSNPGLVEGEWRRSAGDEAIPCLEEIASLGLDTAEGHGHSTSARNGIFYIVCAFGSRGSLTG
jgi:hypothetical protein